MSFLDKLKLKWDISLLSLIVTNLIVIILAIIQKWSVPILLAVYLAQTQIIGFFYFFKIIFKTNTITYGLKINQKTIKPTIANKLGLAVIYYIGFYFVMKFVGFFLHFLNLPIPSFSQILMAFIGIVIFFINHLISFIVNFKIDSEKEETIKELMIAPYLRIIPIIIVIIFGFWINALSIVFLVFKTIVDVYSHNNIHKIKDDYLKYKTKNKKKEIPNVNFTILKTPITPLIKALVIYITGTFIFVIFLFFLLLGATVNFWFYIVAGLSLIVGILIILMFIKHYKIINEPEQ